MSISIILYFSDIFIMWTHTHTHNSVNNSKTYILPVFQIATWSKEKGKSGQGEGTWG